MSRVRARLSDPRRLDRLHRDILGAMDRALEASNPRSFVRRHVKLVQGTLRADRFEYTLREDRRIFVIGAGKASGYMAEELERVLGTRIAGGLVIIPEYLRPWPRGSRVMYRPGTHPFPTHRNVLVTIEMLDIVKSATRHDLVVNLVSGGASALMEYPIQGIPIVDLKRTTELLMKSGANIGEINAVRKHLSRVKGGRLAELLQNTNVLTLVISDVVGAELDVIGSGPTSPDSTSFRDSRRVLMNYEVWSKIPTSVRNVLELGVRGLAAETPKKGDMVFRSVKNLIVGSNRDACNQAVAYLKQAGYGAVVLSARISGEAREIGRVLGSIASDMGNSGFPVSLPGAFVCGGEPTVTVNGKGKGGRNQELALAVAMEIDGFDGVAVASMATDGIDGPTDAAGAIVDGTTVRRGWKLGMDPEEFIRNNDSYNYFRRIGDLIKTGPTGTNVNDVMILCAR